ncbi:DUF2231 domain-containing protein (plasmid) [Ensifer adhaerens]|uniref:DUF2231 domain-containing protein n=1 Tax=Ensifer adhaerens TaxID=106592 RepID=UPI001CBB127D|nr:DUF2231 domain-containing protein [Ensifer adhaerens]MBZ7927495.1 DUF2231 domain-containing protein [Ensifer adhaerens]UAX97918.1 DUF2231 domain-containing protein [Ensifer adhaerens]UAY05297.1 DUF2231 domain-containing protein [Ensifer adhaerens]UAY12675.1 DUF2231 domain-containing protein [Ensifer adhaerens]
MATSGNAHPRYAPHELIAAFAIGCMIGGLLTDIAYWKSAEFIWADFSTWLVSAAVVAAILAGVVALIDHLIFRSRRSGPRPLNVAAGIVVLVLLIFNMMIHSRDAWTSVVPWGLTLSAVTVLVVLLTGLWRIVELRRTDREIEP